MLGHDVTLSLLIFPSTDGVLYVIRFYYATSDIRNTVQGSILYFSQNMITADGKGTTCSTQQEMTDTTQNIRAQRGE
jgi:hypothetical protein